METKTGVVILLLFFICLSLSFGIDAQNVELVGRLGGRFNSVAVQGSYAYIAESYGLLVMDISNPANPRRIGTLMFDMAQYSTSKIVVNGNYAYLAGTYYGMYIVDISTPSNPVLVTTYKTPGYVYDIVVRGNYAYIADMTSLQIINIATASHPTYTGSFATTASRLGIIGNYAYISNGSTMNVINISTASNPTYTGYFYLGSSFSSIFYNVAFSGNYAYFAEGYGYLEIFDVSTPSQPVFVTKFNPNQYTSFVYGVTVNGNYAYLADNQFMDVVDISAPSSPILVSSYTTSGASFWGIDVKNNYVYVVGMESGFYVFDVSTASSPLLTGEYLITGQAYGLAVSGNYLYAGEWNYFKTIDLSTANSPRIIGKCKTTSNTVDIVVSGNKAYTASGDDGFLIFDISTPGNPGLVGSYNPYYWSSGIAVSGNYAYVANENAGLYIFDITTSSSPNMIYQYTLAGYGNSANDVVIKGNYAYVAWGVAGLHIVDITDPYSPVSTGTYNTPGEANEVAINGNYAYVADYNGGLRIIDISTVSNPHEVGFFNTGGQTQRVTVNGNYAYVVDFQNGLRILNISNPTQPTEVGYFKVQPYNVTVSGKNIYLTSEANLWVFQLASPEVSNIPDVKLLKNKAQSDVFQLNDYLENTTSANWSWSSQSTFAYLNIDSSSWVDYLTPWSPIAGQDTVVFTASGVGIDTSILKYSSYLFSRFPQAVVDNGRKFLNCDINLQNYISKDTSIGYPSSYPYAIRYTNSIDSGKLSISFSGSTIRISPQSALTGTAQVIVNATPGSAADWDKELIHVSEVVDTYGEFSSASDTSHYWYLLPVIGANSLPTISWVSSAGGGSGVLQMSFTTASEGVKLVYNQEVNIEPGTWYALRCAFASGGSAGNQHQVSGQLFMVDTVTGTTEVGSFLRQPGQLRDTTWWTQYVYIHNPGSTVKRLRPMLVVKNNGSSGSVLLDSLLLYPSEPLVERAYGALAQASLPNGSFDNGLSGWFYGKPMMGIDTAAPLPGYSVLSSFSGQGNVLQLSYPQVLQGMKLTSDPVVNLLPLKSTRLTWKVYGVATNPNRSVSGRVYCIDTATGGVLSDVLGPSGVNSGMPTGEWVTYTVVGSPLLPTETQARVQLVIKNGNTAGDTVYLDEIVLEQENDFVPYYWDHNLF